MSSRLGRPPAEVKVDAGLVRRLLAAQFPQWADLPVQAVPGAGRDNVIYRLGGDLAVRLPRRLIGAEQVAGQHRWLPVLAGRLPLAIPVVDFGLLGVGDPAVDLMVAWTFLSAPARDAFRRALPADDATWERGRGWALDLGLRCDAYSADNPLLGEIGKYTVSQVLTELDAVADAQ